MRQDIVTTVIINEKEAQRKKRRSHRTSQKYKEKIKIYQFAFKDLKNHYK